MSVLTGLLTAQDIVLDLNINSKKRLFEDVAILLEKNKGMDPNQVFQCLNAREKLGSTGLGNGVAVPHGRLNGVKQEVACFVRTKKPIDFDSPDGKPVNLIFVLLVCAPETADDAVNAEHLKILSHIAGKFAVKETREKLRKAKTPEEVLALLL